MIFHSDADLEYIAHGIIVRTLPKADWTHPAHWAAAAWLLAVPEIDAHAEMPGLIRAYNEACGVPNTDHDGYHETITLASLHMMALAMGGASPGKPLYERVNSLVASALGRPDWILSYWSSATLFSPRARRAWVTPDLAPLPASKAAFQAAYCVD